MGEEPIKIQNSFTWNNEEDKGNHNQVIEKFENFFMPKKNIVLERFRFNNISQRHQKDFDRFITKVKNQAASCECGALKDQLICDRVVVGIKNKNVQHRLVKEKDMDLEEVMNIAKTSEVTKLQVQQLQE